MTDSSWSSDYRFWPRGPNWVLPLALLGAMPGFYADLVCSSSWLVWTTIGAGGGAIVGLVASRLFKGETRLAIACWVVIQLLLVVGFLILGVTIAVIACNSERPSLGG